MLEVPEFHSPRHDDTELRSLPCGTNSLPIFIHNIPRKDQQNRTGIIRGVQRMFAVVPENWQLLSLNT